MELEFSQELEKTESAVNKYLCSVVALTGTLRKVAR